MTATAIRIVEAHGDWSVETSNNNGQQWQPCGLLFERPEQARQLAGHMTVVLRDNFMPLAPVVTVPAGDQAKLLTEVVEVEIETTRDAWFDDPEFVSNTPSYIQSLESIAAGGAGGEIELDFDQALSLYDALTVSIEMVDEEPELWTEWGAGQLHDLRDLLVEPLGTTGLAKSDDADKKE